MTGRSLVSIIVPARNEAVDIERCLEAIGSQDYPKHLMEVLVVDGSSTDETAETARTVLERLTFHRSVVVTNPRGTTPSNLNLGLSMAHGDFVCRVDARSIVPPQYVRTCVAVLSDRPDLVVVGGAQVAIPPRAGAVGAGIARALNNPYATGFSRYRRRRSSGDADTVYLGAFRAADLHEVGGWDERFRTNQDFELNRRLAARGGLWFDASLPVGYIPRASLAALGAQYRRFGRWKAAAWLEGDLGILPRQVALLAAPVVPIALLAASPLHRYIAPLLGGLVGAACLILYTSETGSEVLVEGVAVAVIGASWWLGVAEQVCRYLRGERLLEPPRALAAATTT